MLQRFPEWRMRVIIYIDQVANKPLKFGENDCALLSANCILQMTGTDIAEDFRGKYHNKSGMLQIIRDYGGSLLSLCDNISTKFSMPEVKTIDLKPGDPVLFKAHGAQFPGIHNVLGVMANHGIVVAQGLMGLVVIRPETIIKGWSI